MTGLQDVSQIWIFAVHFCLSTKLFLSSDCIYFHPYSWWVVKCSPFMCQETCWNWMVWLESSIRQLLQAYKSKIHCWQTRGLFSSIIPQRLHATISPRGSITVQTTWLNSACDPWYRRECLERDFSTVNSISMLLNTALGSQGTGGRQQEAIYS